MNDSTEQEMIQDEVKTENIAQATLELPGRRLRAHREGSHLSREEVAHHLRLDAQLIKALEEDDYSRLPSPAYICGYLRSYARLLKLPEDEIVKAYSHGEEINAALIPSSVSILPKKVVNMKLIKTIVIFIIVALLAAGLYLLADKFDIFDVVRSQKVSQLTMPVTPKAIQPQTQEVAPSPEVNTPPPSVNTEAAVTPTAPPVKAEAGKVLVEQIPTAKTEILGVPPKITEAAPVAEAAPAVTQVAQDKATAQTSLLRLHFLGDSWAEVSDSTGKRLVYQLAEKNTDLNLTGEPPFTILLGNAPEVQVFYKGKEFDHTRYHRDEIAYFRVGVK
jgi:cytoskeleton protein RodZ